MSSSFIKIMVTNIPWPYQAYAHRSPSTTPDRISHLQMADPMHLQLGTTPGPVSTRLNDITPTHTQNRSKRITKKPY